LQLGATLEERFVFPGKHCYPLSPADNGENEEDEEEDQIKIIIRTLGYCTAEDLSFL